MFPCTSLTEEGVEGIVAAADGFVAWHGAVGLDAVLQAVELPAGIADLHASLTNMDWDALTLRGGKNWITQQKQQFPGLENICTHTAWTPILQSW